MKIANPTYDVVFKYLMENNVAAKDILSVILNEEIVSLELQSQEFTETSSTGLQIFRLDFKAVIRTKSGELKTILIEIQKSKNGFKIGRFQTYLGFNYMKSHIILNENKQTKDERYPITAIYFLGFRLKNVKIPVLKVARQYYNGVTNHKLNVKEDFVEKLSHDLYAIQIPRLKMHVRTELEQILDVFNQKKYKTTDSHILEYTGGTNDPRVARVVKHLGRAIVNNPDLLHAMVMEDLMEAEAERERIEKLQIEQELIEAKNAKIEAENAKVEAENAKVEAENAKVEAENAKVEAENAKIEAENAKVEAENANSKKGLEIELLKSEVEALKLKLQEK